jgi:hypothetical protein
MATPPKYFMYFPGNYRWSAAFVNMLGRARLRDHVELVRGQARQRVDEDGIASGWR